MQETDFNPTLPSSEPAEGLEAAALRAQAWYGEPFLHAGEDPAAALAPGTARRGALDDAVAEMDAGNRSPSAGWRVRYGLMLGLERVLATPKPQTASGTDLRRHQVDALAGMLTELIAANQRSAEENGNGIGNGNGDEPAAEADVPDLDEEDDDFDAGVVDIDVDEPAFKGEDPGPPVAIASATRPPPGRRSPLQGSSSRPGISASGYANLGALLMSRGLPYKNSDAGRDYSAALTALMTGEAYAQSARIRARLQQPLLGFREEPRALPARHAEAPRRDARRNPRNVPSDLYATAKSSWDDAVEIGEASGYRNAQATVLAPTGTIGFMMDCDTTGVEPDIALVNLQEVRGRRSDEDRQPDGADGAQEARLHPAAD